MKLTAPPFVGTLAPRLVLLVLALIGLCMQVALAADLERQPGATGQTPATGTETPGGTQTTPLPIWGTTPPSSTENGSTRAAIPPLTATRPGIQLLPGDVISVNVADEPALTGQYTVREDGKIIFPEDVGAVTVQGLTPTQVADILAEKLKKFVVNPVVAVQAISMLPRVITVIGQVPRPGVYDLRQFPSLIPLLSIVGGLDVNVDLSQAMLVRSGEVARLVMQAGTGTISIPKDVPLMSGDTIIIPTQGMPLVSLTGAVAKVVSVPLNLADTAAKAIVISGGVLPTADLPEAYVLRAGKHIPMHLDALLDNGVMPPGVEDVKLQAGDIIVVPIKKDKTIYLTGEVKTQGLQPLEKASSVSRAVAIAGGLAETANGKQAYIIREGKRIPVDINALLTGGQPTEDVALVAGDVLVVPKQLRMVLVTGQVAKPASFPLELANTPLAALAAAGGPTPEANLEGTILLRDGKPIPFDANALLNRGDTSFDVALQPDDTIIVPKLLDRVYLMGAVLKSGDMPIHQGDTLIDILGRAGGVAPNADVNKIVIARRPTATELRELERTIRAKRAARLKQAPASSAKPPEVVPPDEQLPAEVLAAEIVQQNVKLYSIARVQTGADIYLARPGDLIYVPVHEEREAYWRNTITGFITNIVANILFWRR